MITALLIFIVAAMSLGGIITALVLILGQEVPSVEKVSSYECGFEPFGDARDNFDVTFYLVGLLFLIFDVEIAFLFPGSVLIINGSKTLLGLIRLFSRILVVGFILEMKLGVLDGKGKVAAQTTISDNASAPKHQKIKGKATT